jgi:hypothetical protein
MSDGWDFVSRPGRTSWPRIKPIGFARAFRLILSQQASDVVIPLMAGQDVLPYFATSLEYTIQTQNPGSVRIRHRHHHRPRHHLDHGLLALEKNGDEPRYYQKGPKTLKGLKATILSASGPAGLLEKPGRGAPWPVLRSNNGGHHVFSLLERSGARRSLGKIGAKH